MQPAATSAVHRELHPEQYDLSSTTLGLDKVAARLELVSVQMARLEEVLKAPLHVVQVQRGHKVKLPSTFAEVVGEPGEKPAGAPQRETPLMTTEEVDALMGW